MSHSEVAKLLAGFVSIDNSIRNECERSFGSLKEQQPRAVLLALVHLLAHSANYEQLLDANMGREAISSLSAVLLRGITVRERALWASLATSDVVDCRDVMLRSLLSEPVPHVRRKIANTVAAHAKLSPWPELLAVVQQLAQPAAQETSRLLSMFLLDQLAEQIGDYLVGHMGTLWAIIAPVLAGESGEALVSAAAAGCSLCSMLTEVRAHAASTSTSSSTSQTAAYDMALWGSGLARSAELARVLACTGQYEESAQQLLIALLRLAEVHVAAFSARTSNSHSNSYFEPVVHSLLAIVACVNAADNMRSLALQTITELVTSESNIALVSQAMRHSVLSAAMNACTHITDASDEGTADFLAEAESSHSSGGIGYSGGSGESDLSSAAGTSLSAMCCAFDPKEVVQVCLHSAWTFLFDVNNWCSRRAALFVISIICEGAREEVEPLLSDLIPSVLSSCMDPHPRVRYTALQCLVEFIRQFRSVVGDEDEEEEWGDEEEEEEGDGKSSESEEKQGKNKGMSFQQQFITTVPPALCSVLQANSTAPRIAYMSVHALLLFFDPDYCDSALCDSALLHGLLQHCMQMMLTLRSVTADGRSTAMQPTAYPLFVLHETASLIGNLSNLLPEDIMSSHYSSLMSVMRRIVGDLSQSENKADHAVVTLQCRCLESIAFIGKAVSIDMFRYDALALAQQLARLTSAGLDFSDELSSYISQTCVRLAGVLGAEFESYVPLVLPSVIAHIAQEIAVEVSVAEEAAVNNRDTEEENAEVFHVYKRGVGLMRVQVSSYALQEKVMACRVLYQYTLDVPQFLAPYVPSAVDALVEVMRSFAFDEECAEVVSATLGELMALYCRQIPHALVLQHTHIVQHMFERAVGALVSAIELKQGQESAGSGTVTRVGEQHAFLHHMLDGLREMMQLLYALRATNVHTWALNLPHELSIKVLAVSRDQLMGWINVRYAGSAGQSTRSELLELEHSIRDCCTDILGWTLKISSAGGSGSDAAGDLAVQQAYSEEVLPLLEGVMTSNFTSASAAPLLIVPVLGLLDTIQCIPATRRHAAQLLLPQLLRIWECEPLAVSCVYGLGLCVQYAQAPADQLSATLMILVQVLGLDPTAQPLQIELDQDQAELLHDNAVASVLRLAVYARATIGSEIAAQMLSLGLDELPLHADKTEAKVVHEWFLAMVATRDPLLFDAEVQLVQGASCFRVAAALVLHATAALCKQLGISSDTFSSAKSNARKVGKRSKSAKKADDTSKWAPGEEDQFWADQVTNKATYRTARALVIASLQDVAIAATVASFSKKQQKMLQQLGSPVIEELLA